MLKKYDWIHIGITIIAVTLCVLGVIYTEENVAKLASGLTGSAFLLADLLYIFIFRVRPYLKFKKHNNNDYDISIILSKQTKSLNRNMVNSLCEWLINFWSTAMGWDTDEIKSSIKGTTVKIEDVYDKEVGGRRVKAFTLTGLKKIFIYSLPKEGSTQDAMDITMSLFRHELSHIICVYFNKKYQNEEIAHQLFADKNLGA